MFRFGYGRRSRWPARSRRTPASRPAAFGRSRGRSPARCPGRRGHHVVRPDPAAQDHGTRRLFGIGHGDFRVTPLQVANTFATLARGGQQKMPRSVPEPRPAGGRSGGSAHLHDESGDGRRRHERGGQRAGRHGARRTSGQRSVRPRRNGLRQDRLDRRAPRTRGSPATPRIPGAPGSRSPWWSREASDGGSDAAPLGRAIFELCADAGYLGN